MVEGCSSTGTRMPPSSRILPHFAPAELPPGYRGPRTLCSRLYCFDSGESELHIATTSIAWRRCSIIVAFIYWRHKRFFFNPYRHHRRYGIKLLLAGQVTYYSKRRSRIIASSSVKHPQACSRTENTSERLGKRFRSLIGAGSRVPWQNRPGNQCPSQAVLRKEKKKGQDMAAQVRTSVARPWFNSRELEHLWPLPAIRGYASSYPQRDHPS